jgi:hypothetical protein
MAQYRSSLSSFQGSLVKPIAITIVTATKLTGLEPLRLFSATLFEGIDDFENPHTVLSSNMSSNDRLCGLVVKSSWLRFGDPGSIPGTTRKKK